jgi:hypothetical protein
MKLDSARAERGRAARTLIAFAIAIAFASSFAGCGDEFSSCEARKICATGGSAGMDSGSGGNSSEGGTIGTAGSSSGGANQGGVAGGEAGASGSAGSAGSAGEAGTGGSSGGCDLSSSPSVTPCVATNEHAWFVAPSGSDSGAGTREKPFKTLRHALDIALADPSKVVIACNVAFRESLFVNAGVRMYGGFGCPGTSAPWVYQPGTTTIVAPPSPGPAIEIRGVSREVIVEDFEFLPDDASTPGTSSIAASVAQSSNVVFRRTRLTAGKAGNGAAGSDGEDGEDGLPSTLAQNGPTVNECPCPTDMLVALAREPVCLSRGGDGGGTIFATVAPTLGRAGEPGPLDNRGMLGSSQGTAGDVGAPGSPGKSSGRLGSFSDQGYTPAPDAAAGSDGAPGQGGGGGAAGLGDPNANCCGGFGGAGGMGGCGGKAGKGGGGGGASIALLVWDSSVNLEACRLIASDGGGGGKGGNGGLGGKGQPGGLGGLGYTGVTKHGGDGGPGADGGIGGPGAGGTGGPSIGIVVHGNAPITDAKTTITVGNPGAAGVGGTSLEVQGDPGSEGFTAKVWPIVDADQ